MAAAAGCYFYLHYLIPLVLFQIQVVPYNKLTGG